MKPLLYALGAAFLTFTYILCGAAFAVKMDWWLVSNLHMSGDAADVTCFMAFMLSPVAGVMTYLSVLDRGRK